MTDVKHVLMEYCRIEMTFAAKCLEQWSECYQKIAKVSSKTIKNKNRRDLNGGL